MFDVFKICRITHAARVFTMFMFSGKAQPGVPKMTFLVTHNRVENLLGRGSNNKIPVPQRLATQRLSSLAAKKPGHCIAK